MTASPSGPVAEAVAAEVDGAASESTDQRTRILETALELMSERGAHTMSMRQLAAACGLNVATIYHYFPSKAALLQAVLEDKRYLEQLADTVPEFDATLPPGPRLVEMVRWFFQGVVDEESTWRLLLGEGLRGEEVALSTVSDLSTAIADTIAVWLRDRFPELTIDSVLAARAIRDQVLAFCVEHLTLDAEKRKQRIEERANDLAALLFPDAG